MKLGSYVRRTHVRKNECDPNHNVDLGLVHLEEIAQCLKALLLFIEFVAEILMGG